MKVKTIIFAVLAFLLPLSCFPFQKSPAYLFHFLDFCEAPFVNSPSRHPVNSPTKTCRVACVGNSVTYGYGLSDRDHDAYPVRLQDMLGSGYEVANFGHSGATLLNRGHRPYIQMPEFRQALDFKADWVVIHLGLNDTDPRNWPDWKEDFIPDYRALIDSFLNVNPQARVLICLMTPIFDRHPRFQSGTRDWHAQIQNAIRQVALGANVQLINLFEPFHARPDLFPDALHPNREGARILARTVYGALTGDYGGLQLPPLYGNGMVIQRDQSASLNGKADTRQFVTIQLRKNGRNVHTCQVPVHSDGTWQCQLPPQQAGGPFQLMFTTRPMSAREIAEHYPPRYPVASSSSSSSPLPADRQGLLIDSVWFGDVWLASGQSNMELRVNQCNSLQSDLADARRLTSRLHLYNMPARARTDDVVWPDSVLAFTNALEHMDMQGWRAATPDVVSNFSAIAFNFGRVLCDSLADVPIGIICNAVGGSTTEAWIDRSTLEWEMPNILTNWREGDYGQAWARGRMTKNISLALDKSQPAYNPLQRHPYEPAYLFESAIRPLQHYALKGVLWYQGESNAHNIELHERLFRLLQQSWRREFSLSLPACCQQDLSHPLFDGRQHGTCSSCTNPSTQMIHSPLPFYFVQLSSLNRPSWPAFRDSQRLLADNLPHTYMAVSSDVGDPTDVHYQNKRPVGERLALLALSHTYGHTLESEGPTPVKAAVETTQPSSRSGGRKERVVRIQFDHARGISVTRGFELAGPDGIFHDAAVRIDGDALLVSSSDVPEPALVRYGWQPFTDADLYNSAHLPASTFCITVSH